MTQKTSKDFGKKEFLLNYANRRWGLTKTAKVGEVMALIRECQPKSFDEWESWYFSYAKTNTKDPVKITKKTLKELGERLYIKLKEIVVPDIKQAINSINLDDCIEYIFNLTLNRTFDGFIDEKSTVIDTLAKRFNNVKFVESDPEWDHAGDVDFLGWLDKNKAIGVQIKPVTANANLGNYSVTARMRKNFQRFKEKHIGEVFIVYSKNNALADERILIKMDREIKRLLKKG